MNIIQVDSREKRNDHILDVLGMYADIQTLNSKLPFGDYCNISKNAMRVVERKNSINELCTCLGTQRNRFTTELRNGTKLGFHIIILVEAEGYSCLEDLNNWQNPFKARNPHALSGLQIYKILKKFLSFYNIEIVFTTKDQAGFDVVRLLKAEA